MISFIAYAAINTRGEDQEDSPIGFIGYEFAEVCQNIIALSQGVAILELYFSLKYMFYEISIAMNGSTND